MKHFRALHLTLIGATVLATAGVAIAQPVAPPKPPADPFFAPAVPAVAEKSDVRSGVSAATDQGSSGGSGRIAVPKTEGGINALPAVGAPAPVPIPAKGGRAVNALKIPIVPSLAPPKPATATPLPDTAVPAESSGVQVSTTGASAPARILTGTGGVITRSTGATTSDPPQQNGAVAVPTELLADVPSQIGAVPKLPVLGSRDEFGSLQKRRPVVINAEDGTNDVVIISSISPNRIATNFVKPDLVDDGTSEVQVIGSNIFLTPKATQPFGIFIVDSATGATVSLTLVPRKVPSQTILVQTAKPRTDNLAGGPIDAHAAAVDGLLRKATRGALGKEWLEAPIEAGSAMIGMLRATPERRWTTTGLVIDRFQLLNEGSEIELREESFITGSVKGVTFFPNVRLAPGTSTHVFLLSGTAAQ